MRDRASEATAPFALVLLPPIASAIKQLLVKGWNPQRSPPVLRQTRSLRYNLGSSYCRSWPSPLSAPQSPRRLSAAAALSIHRRWGISLGLACRALGGCPFASVSQLSLPPLQTAERVAAEVCCLVAEGRHGPRALAFPA